MKAFFFSATAIFFFTTATAQTTGAIDERFDRSPAVGPKDDGEAAALLGCTLWGLAGQAGLTDTQACGEQPFNAEVNRMIKERQAAEPSFDMNGGGVLIEVPEVKDGFPVLDIPMRSPDGF